MHKLSVTYYLLSIHNTIFCSAGTIATFVVTWRNIELVPKQLYSKAFINIVKVLIMDQTFGVVHNSISCANMS